MPNFYSSRATFLTCVPNVAKRSIHDNNVIYIEDQRPTDLAFWKISNDRVSETVYPDKFVFGSRVKV